VDLQLDFFAQKNKAVLRKKPIKFFRLDFVHNEKRFFLLLPYTSCKDGISDMNIAAIVYDKQPFI
jgi:hypothetical protein